MYKLTTEGIKKYESFISECKAKRKEIIDAGIDTAYDTNLPTLEDIESDIDYIGIDPDGYYYNNFCVTDNYDSDYPICLALGIDFIELMKIDSQNISCNL